MEKNDVVKAIRGCIVSNKGKLPFRQLDHDYRTMIGERIPYQRFGFKNLEDFIKSESTFILSKNNAGELFVDATVKVESAHISQMVDKQKSPKRKVLRRTAPRFSSRAATTASWRPKAIPHRSRRFQMSSRPAAVSHNQFVNRPSYDAPSVSSKIVVPETSAYGKSQEYNQPLQRQASQPKHDINTRLRLNKSHLDKKTVLINGNAVERKVSNNGLSVSIQNDISDKENVQNELCSSLASTKKRITKKMSEISLDRDSGNSSPTSEATPKQVQVQVTEFVRTGDSVADLKNFVEINKIQPFEISSVLLKTKRNRLFTCKVRAGKHLFSSYPKDFDSPLKAEKYCAELALEGLIPIYGRRKSLLLASDVDILERIPPMLEKHNHGIWVWQLQLDYADKYNEQLPVDWLKIIDSSPCIQVEKCMENYVLRHCKPGDKGQKWNTFMTLSDVSVPSNTVQFDQEGRLYAEVTCVMSANEIWCRQCSTEESEEYNEMIGRMEIFYNMNEAMLRTKNITETGYYIAKYDNCWYRIRAISVTEEDVHCFFIDYGDEMTVPKSSIYQLKREYALYQAQAFVCRLVGLEELYETSLNSEMLQSIIYKQVVLEMATDAIDENAYDVSLPVYMYYSESGDSVNQQMIPLLTIESASPQLQKETINEVYVSNIESNGDVYVQIHTHGFDSLQNLLTSLEIQILQNPPTSLVVPITKQSSEGKLYFARYKPDDHWYRVQIIDWSPNEDLAQIYFVDVGNTDVITVNEDVLYPLDKLDDVLSQYPFQAIKVRMAIKEIPEDFVALASKVMVANQAVLLKIIELDDEGVQWVEFFKRNADGGLFCINKSITMEAEMKKGDGNNNLKGKRKLGRFDSKNVPSGGTLERPSLPPLGTFWQVRVPFAVNPYNFFVQPLDSDTELSELMESLQKRYQDVLYSPLHIDQIIPGSIYASKFDDGIWYRTSVIKVIHSGSISVFYCDFGYYANLTVQQLIPLDSEFLELPYQALKAKIAAINPTQSKWTMDDCEYFKHLVEKKKFYSTIVAIERDPLYESDTVLKLFLIDTSTPEDIHIEQELVRRGIAVTVEGESSNNLQQ